MMAFSRIVRQVGHDNALIVSLVLTFIGAVWAFGAGFEFFGTGLNSNLVGYVLLVLFGSIALKLSGVLKNP